MKKQEIMRVGDNKWIMNFDSEQVSDAEFKKDLQGNYWLLHISSQETRKGYATALIQAAIKEYGTVYFCSTLREDLSTKFPGYGLDSRYLTYEGGKLVQSLIKRNIIPSDWFRELIP